MAAKLSKLTAALKRLGACEEAVEWSESLPARTSLKKAWESCERGDWLLWLGGSLDIYRKLLVRSACKCARTALKHVPAGEDRPLKSIETAERWCDGEATIEEVRTAASSAASSASSAASAAYAASAAAYAAYAAAASSAAYAASSAAADAASSAAYAASSAAADAADADARKKSLNEAAAIVRKQIPYRVVLTAFDQAAEKGAAA